MQAESHPAAVPRHRFAAGVVLLTLLAWAFAALAAGVLWADLQPAEREAAWGLLAQRLPLVVVLALAVPLLLAPLLRLALRAWPAAVLKLADDVRVIHAVHPAHRASVTGAPEVRQLASALNELARAHQALGEQVAQRVQEAQARLVQERNRLAALMSELSQGVLVCNREGRVLLYNARAARLFDAGEGDASLALGLGRSVFGVLDRRPLLHALGQLAERMQQRTPEPLAHFVTARGEQLLRAQMAPVPDADGEMAGFVLLLDDITREVQTHRRRDEALQALTQGSRPALANIRAAAETLHEYPEMEAPRRERFLQAIREEAVRLSERLEQALRAQGDVPAAHWPREDMQVQDLLAAVQRHLPQGPRLAWHGDLPEQAWLHVDGYAMVRALAFLLQRLAAAHRLKALDVSVALAGRSLRLTLQWTGPALEAAQLHAWEAEALGLGGGLSAATLEQVLEQHGAQMWWQPGEQESGQLLCLLLPAAEPASAAATPIAAPGRPVYYDFDLFAAPRENAALDERPLAELACTVFDTETTGLSPSEGDEIIAIGAVRILNGRLLPQETFDRLVKPGRAVRREAQAVHGIGMEMLQDQPPLEQVLPAFHRFAEDTVLVGHNAAFDMRLLQLAQPRTGLVFGQPVLDTLLLSALVHPGHTDAEHRLEAVAGRLGVPVVGRHSALGDALVTAEVFLRLLPLLAQRGIRTLRQAREASQKTAYAKLEY